MNAGNWFSLWFVPEPRSVRSTQVCTKFRTDFLTSFLPLKQWLCLKRGRALHTSDYGTFWKLIYPYGFQPTSFIWQFTIVELHVGKPFDCVCQVCVAWYWVGMRSPSSTIGSLYLCLSQVIVWRLLHSLQHSLFQPHNTAYMQICISTSADFKS